MATLALAACGSRAQVASSPTPNDLTSASASPAPSPSANTTNSPSPSRVSGSVVRLFVGGVEQQGGALIAGPRDGPVVVRMLFPFDVDRASVEQWLPRTVTPTWTDDHTVDFSIPQGTDAFKIALTTSKDGHTAIEFVVVNVMFPPSRDVNVYRLADLFNAKAPNPDAPATPAPADSHRVHLPRAGGVGPPGIALSPDAARVLIFDTPQTTSPTGVTVVNVSTDVGRVLATPSPADGPFAFGGWLPDGRALVVGKKAWIGAPDSGSLRVLADLTVSEGSPEDVAVSPDGSIAALSYHGGHVTMLDLVRGDTAALPDVFRACDQSTNLPMAWSLDDTRLASVQCPAGVTSDDASVAVKILDVRTRRVVATTGGGVYGLSTFPTGELLVVRPSSFRGEGAPSLGLVMTFAGVQRRTLSGAAWQESPDGRYLLQMEPIGGAGTDRGTSFTLIDQVLGAKSLLFLPWATHWLPDGRLAGF